MVNAKKHKTKKKENEMNKNRQDMKGRFISKGSNNMDATITFRCTKEFKESLRSLADKLDTDMSTLIMLALNKTYGGKK